MPVTPTPSQYADATQIQLLALTPAAYARFESAISGSPGSTIAALQAASAEADGYLTSQFQLPLVQWDMALVRAVCCMAAKSLYDQFGYNANAPIDQLIERRYQQAIEWLSQVAAETVTPAYIDSSGDGEPAGLYVISDQPVGFTCRGLTNTVGDCDGGPWSW